MATSTYAPSGSDHLQTAPQRGLGAEGLPLADPSVSSYQGACEATVSARREAVASSEKGQA